MATTITNSQPVVPAPPSGPTTNPPGGGRWKWDGAAGQWIPNEPNTEHNPQE